MFAGNTKEGPDAAEAVFSLLRGVFGKQSLAKGQTVNV